MCAYGARGAVALSRLRRLDDGRFAYNMKRSLPYDPKVVKGILMHLALRAEPLPVVRSRGPPPELFEAV